MEPAVYALLGLALALMVIGLIVAWSAARHRSLRLANAKTFEQQLLERIELLGQAQQREEKMFRDEFAEQYAEVFGFPALGRGAYAGVKLSF